MFYQNQNQAPDLTFHLQEIQGIEEQVKCGHEKTARKIQNMGQLEGRTGPHFSKSSKTKNMSGRGILDKLFKKT